MREDAKRPKPGPYPADLPPTWAANAESLVHNSLVRRHSDFDSTLGYPGEGPCPPDQGVSDTDLCELFDALDTLRPDVRPTDRVLKLIALLAMGVARPEKGSLKAAWGVALIHSVPQLYPTERAARVVTKGSERCLREYFKAWRQMDWAAIDARLARTRSARHLATVGADLPLSPPLTADSVTAAVRAAASTSTQAETDAELSVPYAPPPSSLDFDGTLGYPGEGPPVSPALPPHASSRPNRSLGTSNALQHRNTPTSQAASASVAAAQPRTPIQAALRVIAAAPRIRPSQRLTLLRHAFHRLWDFLGSPASLLHLGLHCIERRLLRKECAHDDDAWFWIYARRSQYKTLFALRRHNRRTDVSRMFTRWATRAYRSKYRRALAEHASRKRQRVTAAVEMMID